MENLEQNPKLIPTPPTSARPKSRRSSATKRRLVTSRSNENNTQNATETRDIQTPRGVEPLTHQVSFSKYDVIPPISKTQDVALKSDVCQKEERVTDVSSVKTSSEKRTLYRKGDIFRREKTRITPPEGTRQSTTTTTTTTTATTTKPTIKAKTTSAKVPITHSAATPANTANEAALTSHKNPTANDFSSSSKNAPTERLKELSDNFACPAEPLNDISERLYIAFRSPDGTRLCRYFLPTDRLGDVFVYLRDALNVPEDINQFCLFTSEVPTRRLDGLKSKLDELKIEDRMVLNLRIGDLE